MVLVLAVVCNLGMLGFFKYTDMLISTGNALFHTEMELTHLALPVGISFFTFQAMSYVIDVYRGDVGSLPRMPASGSLTCGENVLYFMC